MRRRTDYELVGDIRALNELTYLVYTPMLEQPLLREPQSAARAMIESAGAEVILRADELADRVTRLIEQS